MLYSPSSAVILWGQQFDGYNLLLLCLVPCKKIIQEITKETINNITFKWTNHVTEMENILCIVPNVSSEV